MMYVDICGRLGLDAELKTSKNGNKFVSMRVASNDFIGGENVTTWVSVIWSGERAIKMQEYLKKGSSVIVRGTPKMYLYDTKDGAKAIAMDVFADRVDFVGGKDTQSSDNAQQENAAEQPQPQAAPSVTQPQVAASASASDDDLPF